MHDFKYSEEDTKEYAELYMRARYEIGYNEEKAATFAKELTENRINLQFKLQYRNGHQLTDKQFGKSLDIYIKKYVEAIHELGYNNQQAEMHAMHELQNEDKDPPSSLGILLLIVMVLIVIILIVRFFLTQ